MLGSTVNAVSYKSAISFGVVNPTFLQGLEGLENVRKNGVDRLLYLMK
jgi:hypothetical protein